MKNVNFIPKRVVLYFHEQLIQLYGGTPGLRDEDLLDSALEQSQASFGGSFLHKSIFEMATAPEKEIYKIIIALSSGLRPYIASR